jgi:hypothetical protein
MVVDHPNTIECAVATWLLDYTVPAERLDKLFEYGCKEGIVPELTYYHQTYAFFEQHYRQIMDLYFEYNLTVPAQTDVKNYLAWKSFELVARIMYNSLYCK